MQILSMQYFHGRNIYAHRPVIKITLDMGKYYRRESHEFPSMEQTLLSVIPTIANHHCSKGKPGGFIERLREGTYLGHITEHVLLELLTLAGQKVVWGKTIHGHLDRSYIVIAECRVKEAGERAAHAAVEIVRNAAEGKQVEIKQHLDDIIFLNSEFGFGPSTASIISACKKRGIPYLSLPGGFVQLGYGKKQKRMFGTLTENISCLACDIASDKTLTKQLLQDVGLPVLPGKIVTSEQEALAAIAEIGFPLTIKPNNGNHGRGVAINLQNKAEVRAAFKVAYMHDKSIILEKYLHGRHYRMLVVNGRLSACAERVSPRIIGDGKTSVKGLINQLNADPRRGVGHGSIRSKILIDPELILTIGKQNKTLDDILSDGEVLILRDNPNLSCGAGADDITPHVHPTFAACVENAAKVVGLDIAGIDIVAEDVTMPLDSQEAAIIEVNASPGLRMHLYPDNGLAQPVGDEIVNMLFPKREDWHVPIVAITGTNGKTTTTRLIGAILAKTGQCVGMTTTGGIYISGNCILKGDTTGPESAKTVLKHPNVTAAVLETARGGILRSGLGYDIADVAIVTNITEDHLGQDGIETLEDLAHVKALVAEAVRPTGTVVLNADDTYTTNMRTRIRSKIAYFSTQPNNPIVLRHLAAGGEAYFVWDNTIFHARGDRYEVICNLNDIPITHGGRALHNVSNVLAAVAAAKSLGISTKDIVETLTGFGSSPSDNPGRLHVEEINGVKVIVDYGHNLAGYQLTTEFARSLTPKRLLAVVGVPGDRNNESISKVGTYAGQAFDQIWIKEDSDLRGRKNGEVAELLKSGALAKMHPQHIKVVLKETDAVNDALASAMPGDVLLVYYEHFEPILQTIKAFQQTKYAQSI